MLIRLTLCLSDATLQKSLKRYLEKEDMLLECFGHLPNPWQRIMRSCADVIVVSQSLMPEPIENGIAMLNALPEVPTIVVLYHDDSSESQTQLIVAGADLVLSSNTASKNLFEAILAVAESRKQYTDKAGLVARSSPNPALSDFSSESRSMYLFMKEVQLVISTTVPLLLLGETGVGKEHLAREIHHESSRSAGPFVTVNTAAIPESLLESELFGHVQGAFTGANRSHRGAFEQAHHGTIFLDEIGDMPFHLQTKLLRTLQEYEVKPLGGESSVWVDVRVIAATNRDLEREIDRGGFRKDLFYRLSVVPLTIPPLRERREDIPSIINRFCELHRIRQGEEIVVSEEATQALCRYDWPGNVRELLNVMERAVILSRDRGEIDLIDLPTTVIGPRQNGTPALLGSDDPDQWKGKTLQEVLEETQQQVERRYLELVLARARGRVGHAAQMAGIHTRTLYNKMRRLGLAKEDFKGAPEPNNE